MSCIRIEWNNTVRVIRINKFVQEQDNVEWLVEGLLPNVGWTLLYGTRGLGKTTFAMQLCDSLQRGVSFLSRKVKKASILYIQADSLADEWKAMLKRIAPQSEAFTCVEVPSKCLGNPEYVNRLSGYVERFKPDFLVWDSLYNLSAWQINTEQVQLAINTMDTICNGKPWLVIHHPPHEGMRAAGHHSIGSKCSNEWALTKNKLRIEKGRLVKDKEIPLSRDENGLWEMYTDDEDFKIHLV
jgi:RecA-family ATPase